MKQMTKDEARAWQARWRLVNEFEREETRRMPLTQKYQQFLSLMEMGRAMKWPKIMDEEIEEVRRRWRRLWEHYRGQAQD
jgi:hypothetical protein